MYIRKSFKFKKQRKVLVNFIEEKEKLSTKEAQDSLFRTWYEPLCQYAYSILKDTFESEDAVQKVFFQLWDSRFEINLTTSIKSYLYRAVHNTCLNRIKQLKIQNAHNKQIAAREEIMHNEVYEKIIGKELDYTIKRTIAELPPRCREVFELSRFEMMSYNEIASALSISPNTVENQIAKALKLLKISLREFIPIILLYYLIKLGGL